jgi:hypothetical protein
MREKRPYEGTPRARPLTARKMKLVPRDRPDLPGKKSRRVRQNKWVEA